LCALLQIQEEKISFEVGSDIRDSYGMPPEIEGKPFETELEVEEGKYKIHIANSLQKHPKRLIYSFHSMFLNIQQLHFFLIGKQSN